MRGFTFGLTIVLAGVLFGASGCANHTKITREPEVGTMLTWQDAKSETLTRAAEIASLLPPDFVVSIEESEKGTLMSCDATQHYWTGWVRIKLAESVTVDTALEALVPMAETHFAGTGFTVTRGRTILDTPRVEVGQPDSGELYLIDEFDPNTIDIDASSDCFTLPEDVYPGGEF